MPFAAIQRLRSVNKNLRTCLARLQAGPDQPAPTTAEFEGLRAELLSATDCLRQRDEYSSADPQLEEEISEYRRSIGQLAKIMPSVSGRLLTEKARLEAARKQVAKTAAWAHANRETL